MCVQGEEADPDPGRVTHQLTDQHGQTGEVCIRDPCVLSSYLDDTVASRESFLPGGYFRTGDLGTLHPDGRLQITGRIKEMINKGGEKISPLDIEHVVLGHASVHQAVCFKVQDDMYGEDIDASVPLFAAVKGHAFFDMKSCASLRAGCRCERWVPSERPGAEAICASTVRRLQGAQACLPALPYRTYGSGVSRLSL